MLRSGNPGHPDNRVVVVNNPTLKGVVMKSRTAILAELELEASTLSVGENVRRTCPFCNSTKPDLSLYHDDSGYGFYCFGGVCPVKSGRLGQPQAVQEPRSKPKRREYQGPINPLSDQVLELLESKYLLDSETLISYGVQEGWPGTIVMPVSVGITEQRGHIIKDLTGKGLPVKYTPKTASYFYDQTCKMAYTGKLHTPIIIVEDMLSLYRLSQAGLTGVSLNGTSISQEDAILLARLTGNVRLALDGDEAGVEGMIKFRQVYGSLFDSVHIHIIPCDVKDMSVQTFEKVFQEYL